MDELNQIRNLLVEPPPPRMEVAAAARERLTRRASQITAPRFLPLPRSRRLGLVALGATAAGAAAALAMVTLVPQGATRPQPAGTGPAGLAGQPARPFLLAMATKARHQQATGRYWCTEAVEGSREIVGPHDALLPAPWLDGRGDGPAPRPAGYRYALFDRSRSGDCMDYGGTVSGYDQSLGARPASPADKAAWHRDGSPDHWRAWYDSRVTVSTHAGTRQVTGPKPGQAPWGSNASLPANPARLRATFLAHPLPFGPSRNPTRNEQLVTAALYVMSGPSSPAVRAAAYQVLAGVPGVMMRPGVTDPEGQTGTAVWGDQGSPGQIIIVDPATGTVLAYEDIARYPVAGAPPGTVLSYTAFISSRWTNHLLKG